MIPLNGISVKYGSDLSLLGLDYKDVGMTVQRVGENRIRITIDVPAEVVIKRPAEKE